MEMIREKSVGAIIKTRLRNTAIVFPDFHEGLAWASETIISEHAALWPREKLRTENLVPRCCILAAYRRKIMIKYH